MIMPEVKRKELKGGNLIINMGIKARFLESVAPKEGQNGLCLLIIAPQNIRTQVTATLHPHTKKLFCRITSLTVPLAETVEET